MADDPPLEEMPDAGTYHGVIIDLADVRIKYGRTPHKQKICDHRNLIYNSSERRVWCEDCQRTIDGFDAFLTITRNFEGMLREANHRLTKATDAMASTVRLRATKALDKAWSGHTMAPCCPHCHGGLLPEDFADGASAMVSAEIERQRRKSKPKN